MGDFAKWIAINIGAKYIYPSSVVVALVCGVAWFWYVKSVTDKHQQAQPPTTTIFANQNARGSTGSNNVTTGGVQDVEVEKAKPNNPNNKAKTSTPKDPH